MIRSIAFWYLDSSNLVFEEVFDGKDLPFKGENSSFFTVLFSECELELPSYLVVDLFFFDG
jgi:hypothetical protein